MKACSPNYQIIKTKTEHVSAEDTFDSRGRSASLIDIIVKETEFSTGLHSVAKDMHWMRACDDKAESLIFGKLAFMVVAKEYDAGSLPD